MAKTIVIVDRIEGKLAVVEFPDRTTKNVPISLLSNDVESGDCYYFEQEKYIPTPEETQKRKMKIEKLAKSVWKG
ncbi:DUF3006 domain-containing protein [Desulfitobacterium sp. AusDCA]|uniref:DUF3006 domain-containing protein n=1 Tax=Desulfitobacterium sp. AusDCA TaxID=3240383 RepID=UPI003DA75E4C